MSKPVLDAILLLYSSDESNAQRFAARMRELAVLQWADSRHFSTRRPVLEEHEHGLVLLDYSKEHAETASEIAKQLTAVDPSIALIGIGSARADRGAGVLAALRAGVKDFIDIDAPDEEILSHLKSVIEHVRNASDQRSTPHSKRGQLILLCSVRPGLGASTLAAHLGALAASAGRGKEDNNVVNKVLLLDLGHSKGDVGLYLGTSGDFHFSDALRNANRIDATLISTAVPHHASGVAVLGQARNSPDAVRDSGDVGPLLDRLLNMFDLIICDLDYRSIHTYTDSLILVANEIWLMADQSVSSLVSLDACLRELEQAKARDLRVSLVMSRHDDDCGISAPRIAERFGLSLLATLPERSRPLRTSANRGSLLHEVSPRDAYIRALAPLLARLRLRVKHTADTPRWKRLFNLMGGTLWNRR